jgi:hypothetical protein
MEMSNNHNEELELITSLEKAYYLVTKKMDNRVKRLEDMGAPEIAIEFSKDELERDKMAIIIATTLDFGSDHITSVLKGRGLWKCEFDELNEVKEDMNLKPNVNKTISDSKKERG